MPIEFMHRYTRADLQARPAVLFVFGDNGERRGTGGQAGEARGEPNAVGVYTKRGQYYSEDDYLSDADYIRNIRWIWSDLRPVLDALEDGRTVVWPSDGIGTGIAQLPQRAPETLKFINNLLASLVTIYDTTSLDRSASCT